MFKLLISRTYYHIYQNHISFSHQLLQLNPQKGIRVVTNRWLVLCNLLQHGRVNLNSTGAHKTVRQAYRILNGARSQVSGHIQVDIEHLKIIFLLQIHVFILRHLRSFYTHYSTILQGPNQLNILLIRNLIHCHSLSSGEEKFQFRENVC